MRSKFCVKLTSTIVISSRNIDSLLNQQILPVLSQQLLGRMSEQQRTTALTLGWDDEEGIVLEFGDGGLNLI